MSLAELKQQVDKLTPAEKNELLEYLDPRPIRDRQRKLAAASAAMKRMDETGGIPLEKVFSLLEERERRGD